MDWQTPEDTVPSAFITEAEARSVLGKPPATGAWREGDPPGDRKFASIGAMSLERGGELPSVRIAYETWGTLAADASNAVLEPFVSALYATPRRQPRNWQTRAGTSDCRVVGGPHR